MTIDLPNMVISHVGGRDTGIPSMRANRKAMNGCLFRGAEVLLEPSGQGGGEDGSSTVAAQENGR